MTANAATVAAVRTSTARALLVVELSDGRRFAGPRKAVDGLGLADGMALFPGTVERLDELQAQAAYALTVKWLSRWERSAAEVSRYLAERGFGANCIEATVERLRANHALDDARAAESHVATRRRSTGKGKRLVQGELVHRGIPAGIAEEATAEMDDRAAAYDLALMRGKRRDWADATAFEATVGPFLQRRGFDYETAKQALQGAWRDLQDERKQA